MSRLVGVLALQGAFNAHQLALNESGALTRLVRNSRDLDGLQALVLPGGESTTMSMLLETSALFDPICRLIGDGLPVFGTCAGMILLANKVHDARPDQKSFGAIDIDVKRNAYGTQVDSFEADIKVASLQTQFHAVFIRAPQVVRVGDKVEVLATLGDDAVLARENNVMVASFHPELTPDTRIHQIFLASIK